MVKTKGRLELVKWAALDPKVRTQTFIALQCGVGQPSVSGWFRGSSRPDASMREVLFALAGISPTAWLTKAEKRLRAEAVAVAQASGGKAA